jgi:hypothetical protein
MGKRIKSEKKGGGESKFIEEYTPLLMLMPPLSLKLETSLAL